MSAERTAAPQSWEEAVVWLKGQPDQAQLVRDCYFDDPLIGAAERHHAACERQAVRRMTGPAAGRALDVGTGARLLLPPVSVLTPSLLSRLGWLLRSPGANYSFFGVRDPA